MPAVAGIIAGNGGNSTPSEIHPTLEIAADTFRSGGPFSLTPPPSMWSRNSPSSWQQHSSLPWPTAPPRENRDRHRGRWIALRLPTCPLASTKRPFDVGRTRPPVSSTSAVRSPSIMSRSPATPISGARFFSLSRMAASATACPKGFRLKFLGGKKGSRPGASWPGQRGLFRNNF